MHEKWRLHNEARERMYDTAPIDELPLSPVEAAERARGVPSLSSLAVAAAALETHSREQN